jgi:hypothetical protein
MEKVGDCKWPLSIALRAPPEAAMQSAQSFLGN